MFTYPVSYSFVVAFHPCLNLENIFVVRSFNHLFESLVDVGYLSEEMLPYFDPVTASQLKHCAITVFNKKERFSLSEMFSCELKFVIDLLKKWLADKFFKRFRELDYFTKQKFKNENPINWSKTNCVICGFRLSTNLSYFPNEKLETFLDNVIAKEHTFIRNIYDHDEIQMSKPISTIENYHVAFKKMLHATSQLNSSYPSESDIENIMDNCVVEFLEETNSMTLLKLFLKFQTRKSKY